MEWNAGSVKRNPPETVTGLQELMQIYLPKKNYFNTLRRPWPVSSYFVFFDNESWWQLLIFQDWWSFPNSLPTSNFGRKYFSGKLYWRTIYNQLNHPSCILKDNAIQYWRAIKKHFLSSFCCVICFIWRYILLVCPCIRIGNGFLLLLKELNHICCWQRLLG